MPDQTIKTLPYYMPITIGRGKLRRTVTWAAWSSTHAYIKGHGMTEEEAIEDLEENLKMKGGDHDAE